VEVGFLVGAVTRQAVDVAVPVVGVVDVEGGVEEDAVSVSPSSGDMIFS